MSILSVLIAAVTTYTIPSGTTYTLQPSDPNITAETLVNIQSGATLDLATLTPTFVAVTGSGAVINGTMTLTLVGGPYRFDGQAKEGCAIKFAQGETPDAEFGFIVGASDTLADATVQEPATTVHPLRFVSGAGVFCCKTLVCAAGPTLVLEDVDKKACKLVTGVENADNLVVSGKGTLHVAAGVGNTVTLKNDALAGLKGQIGVVSGTLKFWNNACDLSSVGGFFAENGATLDFRTGTETDVFDQPISGTNGVFYFRRPVELNNMNVRNAKIYFNNNATNVVWRNGLSTFTYISYASPTTYVSVVSGGLRGTSRAYNTGYNKWGQDYYWNRGGGNGWGDGGSTINNRNYGNITIRDGGVYAVNNTILGHRVEVLAGGVVDNHGQYGNTGALGNYTLLDGGAFWLTSGEVYTSGSVFREENKEKCTLAIGRAGGTFWGCCDAAFDQTKWAFGWPLRSAFSDGTADGGVSFSGAGIILLQQPMLFKGPFRLDTCVSIDKSLLSSVGEGQYICGYGDFVLGNASIYSDITTDPIRLGAAPGTKTVLDGAATIRGTGTQQFVLGAGDAADGQAVDRKKGGVLFFFVNDGNAVDGTTSTLKVNGGLERDSGVGIVKHPILTLRKTSSGYTRADFARYDNEKGLVQYEDYADGVTNGDNLVAWQTGWKVDLPGNANFCVRGLVVDSYQTTGYTDISNGGYTLGIPDSTTLTVGNGVDPAVVILNGKGNGHQASIKGGGVLDFGASEGVFVCHRSAGYNGCESVVGPRVRGRGGVTVCSPNCFVDSLKTPSGIHLTNPDNDYTGGTFVNSAALLVTDGRALSTGDIWFGRGSWGGSSVCIEKAGVVVTNAIHAWGDGRPYSYMRGALHFSKTGEFSGPVELCDRVRLMTADNTVTGTVSGVMSGDRLLVWGGVVNITAANTYSNGTLIAKGSVVRLNGEGASLGTGPVVIDPATLDMCGYDHAFHSVRGCGDVVNTGLRRATMTLAQGGDLSTGRIAGKIRVVVSSGTLRIGSAVEIGEDVAFELENGASIDWCGAARSVRYLAGDGRVLDGTYTESHPKGGIVIIVR